MSPLYLHINKIELKEDPENFVLFLCLLYRINIDTIVKYHYYLS